MTGHSILQIVKGIAQTPGDTLSAEAGLDSIDFLDPLGFSVDTYEMKIPALKSSAVYADSPLVDGRTLISGVLGNVNETIRLTLTAGTIMQMSAMLSKLLRFKQDCNNFWDTFGQIEPVYIKHQVSGEPGPRYALLYDIDIAIDSTLTPGDPQRDITVVIEREYGWRGIAPGANPKRWAVENVNEQQWNSASASLISETGDLIKANIVNKTEFNTATTLLTQNFVDIPASSIPGDLPALLCLTVEPSSIDVLPNIYVSRSTKSTTLPNRAGGTALPQYNDMAAAWATMNIADTTLQTDTDGLVYSPLSANSRAARISFATLATLTLRLTWNANVHRSIAVLRGTYALFLRARQNAGASGNTGIQLNFYELSSGAGGTPFYTSPTITPTVSTSVALHYVGVVSIPGNQQAFVGLRGTGIGAASAANYGTEFSVGLSAVRSTGTATLDIFDLVLMPIDEGMSSVQLNLTSDVAGADCYTIMDNTSYFSHGRPDDLGMARQTGGFTTNDQPLFAELKGNGITLTPKTNNRLYFLMQRPTTLTALPGYAVTVIANIVPRWSGLRDV